MRKSEAEEILNFGHESLLLPGYSKVVLSQQSEAQERISRREQIRTEGSKFFMHNWLRARAEAKAHRHETSAQPATRSSQRIVTQLSQTEEGEALTTAVPYSIPRRRRYG